MVFKPEPFHVIGEQAFILMIEVLDHAAIVIDAENISIQGRIDV
jgi:hypothetical protein